MMRTLRHLVYSKFTAVGAPSTFLSFSLSAPVSPTVCRCAHIPPSPTQVFERKWEIGLARESQLNDDDGDLPGPTRQPYDLLRAAAAEFLGTLLLLYNGETLYTGGVLFRRRL